MTNPPLRWLRRFSAAGVGPQAPIGGATQPDRNRQRRGGGAGVDRGHLLGADPVYASEIPCYNLAAQWSDDAAGGDIAA